MTGSAINSRAVPRTTSNGRFHHRDETLARCRLAYRWVGRVPDMALLLLLLLLTSLLSVWAWSRHDLCLASRVQAQVSASTPPPRREVERGRPRRLRHELVPRRIGHVPRGHAAASSHIGVC